MLTNVAPKDCLDLSEAVYNHKDVDKGRENFKRDLHTPITLEILPKNLRFFNFLTCEYVCLEVM